ncbi:hypothetical protein DD237_003475 [Peronospora effusa]|uniref:START domain-containing protein n=1 Tax=Peronospora effusa TaxID=542832 RepID=A0A425CEL8_9STRA|nr:hypothetical protein DD237_003475 [Peronospora effusa]
MTAHWNADDQTLLNILLMTEPIMEDTLQPQNTPIVMISLSCETPRGRKASVSPTTRDIIIIKGETKSRDLCVQESRNVSHVQRQYALLTTEQEHLNREATRLRWLLNYRHQFATNVVALAQRAAFISLDDSDNLDATSTLSTISVGVASPSLSSMSFDTSTLLAILANDCNLSPLSATEEIKTPFYSKPNPSLVGLTVTRKTPLAVLMQIELGYKMLSFSEATMLLDETYRSIVSFSLSGKAISTGPSIMGWENKRLLEGTSLKFSLQKQFSGQNALKLMTSTWQCFSDPECIETKFRGLMTLHILQRVNDDTIVALRESESEDGSKLYRCVYLLFRVRTRNGFLICVQSVEAGRLTDPSRSCVSRDGKLVQWTELSGWFVFEPTADGKTYDSLYKEGAPIEYGGCMDYDDHELAATLSMNMLSTVFKCKSMMVGPIFTLPSSSC